MANIILKDQKKKRIIKKILIISIDNLLSFNSLLLILESVFCSITLKSLLFKLIIPLFFFFDISTIYILFSNLFIIILSEYKLISIFNLITGVKNLSVLIISIIKILI